MAQEAARSRRIRLAGACHRRPSGPSGCCTSGSASWPQARLRAGLDAGDQLPGDGDHDRAVKMTAQRHY